MTPTRPLPSPSRPAAGRPVPARPAASGAGWIVLFAVFCSVLASATTCFVIIRFSLVPAPQETMVSAPIPTASAPVRKSSPKPTRTEAPPASDELVAVSANEPAPTPEIPEGGLAQPRAVAASALDVISAVRVNLSFVGVGSGVHGALNNDLFRLQAAAEAMTSDDGANPAASAKLNLALGAALDAAIARSDAISNRPTESDSSREISAQLRTALQGMRNQ